MFTKLKLLLLASILMLSASSCADMAASMVPDYMKPYDPVSDQDKGMLILSAVSEHHVMGASRVYIERLDAESEEYVTMHVHNEDTSQVLGSELFGNLMSIKLPEGKYRTTYYEFKGGNRIYRVKMNLSFEIKAGDYAYLGRFELRRTADPVTLTLLDGFEQDQNSMLDPTQFEFAREHGATKPSGQEVARIQTMKRFDFLQKAPLLLADQWED